MDFPVCVTNKNITHSKPNISVNYPHITNLPHSLTEKKINGDIVSLLNNLLIEQGFYNESLVELVGTYEIKTNERNILSLSLTVYSFTGGAHGLTITKSLTFDVMTGKQYSLKDLFNPNSNYVEKLSQIISMKIEAWDVPLLEDFTTIRPDQDYYLADHTIVIYFQLYEITPYVYGFPYFPIPIKSIEDIIRTEGPLNTLLTF